MVSQGERKEGFDCSYSELLAEEEIRSNSQESQLMTSFHFEEPQNSLFSMKEQRVYMALLDKFRTFSQEDIGIMLRGDNKFDIDDWNIFQRYRETVQSEQQEFQKWCKDVFIQNGYSGKY